MRIFRLINLIAILFRMSPAIACSESLLAPYYVVIGSGGFIGSSLAKHFSRIGTTLGISRSQSPYTQVIAEIENIKMADWKTKISSHPNPVVFFAAGRPSVADAQKDPDGDYSALIVPLKKTLEFMTEGTLIFFSSAAVLNPSSSYAKHRLIAEDLIKEHAKKNVKFKYHILRPTNVFGEMQRKQIVYDLSFKFLEDDKAQRESIIWGTGNEARDFIHISYLTHFCDLLVSRAIPSNTWTLSSGNPVKIIDLVKTIRSFFNINNPLHFNMKPQASEAAPDNHESVKILNPENYTFQARFHDVLQAYSRSFHKD